MSRVFHKHLCANVANFKDKPDGNMRRVILLPEGSDKPSFQWMTVTSNKDDGTYPDCKKGVIATFVPHKLAGFRMQVMFPRADPMVAKLGHNIFVLSDEWLGKSNIHLTLACHV